jgi:hypothetical protein
MKIKRESVITGIVRTRDIPINPDDWALYQMGFVALDDAMPYLTTEDRDFILSGIIPSEWNSLSNLIESE